jgi:hypothetical protein
MQPEDFTSEPSDRQIVFRAAQYVRMSTEHQQYSTQNQSDKILEYAQRRGIEIVRTYADEGRSGLNIDGRDAPYQGDVIAMQEIFRFEQTGIDADGKVQGHFCATGVRPRFADRLRMFGAAKKPPSPPAYESRNGRIFSPANWSYTLTTASENTWG